jgi:hypothetical protein
MLVVLLLMSAVALMMPRVFTPTMRVVREAPAASNAIATNHVMIEQLRRDVWGASDVRAADDGLSLNVTVAGQTTRWSVAPKETDNGPAIAVTRAAGDAETRAWNVQAVTMHFENSPAGALVRFGPQQASDDSILLVNQLAQLQGKAGGVR